MMAPWGENRPPAQQTLVWLNVSWVLRYRYAALEHESETRRLWRQTLSTLLLMRRGYAGFVSLRPASVLSPDVTG